MSYFYCYSLLQSNNIFRNAIKNFVLQCSSQKEIEGFKSRLLSDHESLDINGSSKNGFKNSFVALEV